MAYNSLIFAIALLTAAGLADKPKTLRLLNLIPYTGEAPRVGIACTAASKIAIDAVNVRQDILSDYKIEVVFRDEGASSNFAHQEFVKFKRSMEAISDDEKGTTFESPVVIGALYGNGCKALGGIVHQFDNAMVAMGCGALKADRRIYPNIYKLRTSGELIAFPQLMFMRQVGGWNRLAIILNAENWFDVAVGLYLNSQAVRNGFNVTFFDSITDLSDQAMLSLKRSDARIIVLEGSSTVWNMKFFCQTYKFGFTGGKFAFFLQLGVFPEPATLSAVIMPGCTREMVFEQLKYTFWATRLLESKSDSLKTPLGYNVKEFNTKFDTLTNYTPPADFDRRMFCHDATLQAIVALDTADRLLKGKLNLTLSDYRARPKLVMQAVNRSLANIQYIGLRLGNVKYSERGEFDDDTQIIAQWTPKDQMMRNLYEVQLLPNASIHSYSSYSGKLVEMPSWFTKDGKAPWDKSREVTIVEEISLEFSWVVIAISSLAATSQMVGLGFAVYFSKKSLGCCLEKVVLFASCLLINAGAVMFSKKSFSDAYCIVERVLTCLGLALLLAILLAKLVKTLGKIRLVIAERSTKSSVKRFQITQSTLKHQPHRVNIRPSSIPTTSHIDKCTKSIHIAALLSGLATSAYLVIWMVFDPTRLVTIVNLEAVYVDATDTYHKTVIQKCSSVHEVNWLLPLASAYGLLAAVGLLMSYQTRTLASQETSDTSSETGKVRLAMLNLTNIFFGTCLLMVVVRSAVYQQIIMSVVLLIISGISSTLLLLIPLVSKVRSSSPQVVLNATKN